MTLLAEPYDRQIEGVGADDVERDANAMRATAEIGLRVPRLIDADPSGERLGWPALLMTRLPGDPRAFGGNDPELWVDGLADVLLEIASAPLPLGPLPDYQSWRPSTTRTPK
ncbi:MAG: aminoglycoside phosphotransferase (APT) family kinase protein, partial [Verrucomicrobiales bacterium]